MSYANAIFTLSNINCGLASLNTYLDQRINGVNPQYATMNLFGNLANGIARNEYAYGMQKMGNSAGNLINSISGYGNPVSNTFGTLGLLNCSPWMYFNCMPTFGFYSGMGFGCSPMMGMPMGLFG
jgi:hypothetical protein